MSGADLVLKNGVILSVTLDGKRINGTAVAVKGGLIVKVGADADMAEYISGNTKVVDCRGNTIMPGMCDAHCHPAIVILPVVAIAVCIFLWFSLTTTAKVVGFSWLGLGIVFLAIKTKGFKEMPPELEL